VKGQQWLSGLTYLLTTGVGIAAFLYPFWLPALVQSSSQRQAHAGDSALMLTLLVGLCLAVLLLEVQSQGVSTKTVALLGVLVAINATLRFAEVAVPGPGGFSPIFPLIVLGGYVLGARFGFLLGVLTLLVSAILTGGVGPWLPYQMFTAGWVGLSAPLCRPLARALGGPGSKGEVAVLAIFGGYWGLLYGAVMNIWFWPFAMGPAQMYWQPGIGLAETLQRYLVFYAVTSLVWDLARMLGNMVLIALGAGAVLRVLRRFQLRFAFTYAPLRREETGV
jgi:energy-coupling factor transport system substrate-specific component